MIFFKKTKPKLEIDFCNKIKIRQMGDALTLYDEEGGFRFRKTKNRIVVNASSSKSWDHPWKTTVAWYSKGSGLLKNTKGESIDGFGAVVKPGFVNGLDPTVPGAPKIQTGTVSRTSGLRGKSEPTKALQGLLDQPVVPLYKNAFALMSRGIPAGLADMGAVPFGDMSVSGNADKGNMAFDVKTQVEGARYVAQAGLYLACARPSVDQNVSGNVLTAIKYNVKYSMDTVTQYGTRARLMVGWPPAPPKVVSPFSPPADDGLDYFMVAIVYLLSPEDPVVDDNGYAQIDESWMPFVRHCSFWNLEYRWKFDPVQEFQTDNPALPFAPFMAQYTMAPIAAAGLAQSLQNQMAGAMAILNAINEMKGRFWTV